MKISVLFSYLIIFVFVEFCFVSYVKNNETQIKPEVSFNGTKIPVYVSINSNADFFGNDNERKLEQIRDTIHNLYTANPFINQKFENEGVEFYAGPHKDADNKQNALEINFSGIQQKNNFTFYMNILTLMVVPGYTQKLPLYDVTYFDTKGNPEKISISNNKDVSQIIVFHWLLLPFFWLSNGDVFSPIVNEILTSNELTEKLNHNFPKKQFPNTSLVSDGKHSCFEKICLEYDLPEPWFISFADVQGGLSSKTISFHRKDLIKSKLGYKSVYLGLIFVKSQDTLDPLTFSQYAKQYSSIKEKEEPIQFRKLKGQKNTYKFFGVKGNYESEGFRFNEYLVSGTEGKVGVIIRVTSEEQFSKIEKNINNFLENVDIKPNLLYKEISENERTKKIKQLQEEGLRKINIKTTDSITLGLNKYLEGCELGNNALCREYSILKVMQVEK
ncbi:MAG: hypothetical protein IPL26_23195 [Leptospiraceae bacterium]|nr:hypothetical protein [Leptospiraceae bacterium]